MKFSTWDKHMFLIHKLNFWYKLYMYIYFVMYIFYTAFTLHNDIIVVTDLELFLFFLL